MNRIQNLFSFVHLFNLFSYSYSQERFPMFYLEIVLAIIAGILVERRKDVSVRLEKWIIKRCRSVK